MLPGDVCVGAVIQHVNTENGQKDWNRTFTQTTSEWRHPCLNCSSIYTMLDATGGYREKGFLGGGIPAVFSTGRFAYLDVISPCLHFSDFFFYAEFILWGFNVLEEVYCLFFGGGVGKLFWEPIKKCLFRSVPS